MENTFRDISITISAPPAPDFPLRRKTLVDQDVDGLCASKDLAIEIDRDEASMRSAMGATASARVEFIDTQGDLSKAVEVGSKADVVRNMDKVSEVHLDQDIDNPCAPWRISLANMFT